MMKRLRTLLGQSEFHVLLFCLCLVLFTRPLLVMSTGEFSSPVGHSEAVLRSLYLPWAGVIFLLFLVARSSTAAPSEGPGDEEDGGMSDA